MKDKSESRLQFIILYKPQAPHTETAAEHTNVDLTLAITAPPPDSRNTQALGRETHSYTPLRVNIPRSEHIALQRLSLSISNKHVLVEI